MAGRQNKSGTKSTGPVVTFYKGEMRINKSVLAELGYDAEEWSTLLTACLYDDNCLELFCKTFFPESFKRPFTKERREFARLISDPSHPYTWGMGYRGFGKTTLVWAECVRELCFRICPFLVYVSSELALAERRTESIRQALITNPLIREMFGSMQPQYMDGMREVFGAKAWKVSDPHTNEPFAIVTPKSDETTVNGLVEYVVGRYQRPSKIVVDDITDRRRVHDENYRAQQKEWAFGTLFPCVDTESQPDPETHKWTELKRGDIAPYQICVVDTCKHTDALIENCAQHPEFFGNRFPLAGLDTDGNIISFVAHLSNEQVQAMYERQLSTGKEDRFYKEYMCRSIASSDAVFPSDFQYYDETSAGLNHDNSVIRMIIVDPARSRNPRSAFTAMLAVGVNCNTATVYLRGMIHARMSDIEIANSLFSFASKMNSQILAIEDNGLSDWIRGPLERTASARGFYPHFMWIPTGRQHIEAEGEYRNIKEVRASSALWLYRSSNTHKNGHVLHDRSLIDSPLENQMRNFPENKYWDALDTLGHLDWVMRTLGLSFLQQEENVTGESLPKTSFDEWGEMIESGSWDYMRAIA